MVVDDDALVRLGLTDLLDGDDDVEVVAQATDGLHAVELATAHHVDVALVDVRMPRMDGITATARLRALPHPPRVITLTTFDLDAYVYDALAAGADGFLLKDTEPAEILRAVHLVAAGSAMLHPAAARRLIDRFHRTDRPRTAQARTRIDRLTPRETDVLALLAEGGHQRRHRERARHAGEHREIPCEPHPGHPGRHQPGPGRASGPRRRPHSLSPATR